jgi:hypothetical protein
MAAIHWRRLDVAGTDEAELVRTPDGWRVTGIAVFGSAPDTARLAYAVEADAAWHTRRGEVRGTVGARVVALEVVRLDTGDWWVDGRAVPALRGLVDLDLGFTPATNLFPLRRLALRPGEASDASAAWLDDVSWSFSRLEQRYERRDREHYWYESPGYQGLLTVTGDGFVRDYPGLWRAAEAASAG